MRNHWLNQRVYQLAFLKDGEWYHLRGFSDYFTALNHYNNKKAPCRLLSHFNRHNVSYKYYVDDGKVLLEKK